MKITIDTKEDSHEDLKKVIRMLQHLVGEQPKSNQPNIFEDPNSFGKSEEAQGQSDAFLNLFGTSGNQKEEPNDSKEEPEEIKDDIPEVIPY